MDTERKKGGGGERESEGEKMYFVSHFGEQRRTFSDVCVRVAEMDLAENEEITLRFGSGLSLSLFNSHTQTHTHTHTRFVSCS